MKRIFFILSLATLAVSCNEEFLDSAPTETIATPQTSFKLNGLYVMMINTGTGGTTAHEDFGQKGYDIISDLLSADMALARNGYNRYLRVANLSATVDFTQNTPNYIGWRYYYRVIGGANDIINDLGGNDAVPTAESDKYIMGQAKALRAYAYFYLAQFYNTSYKPEEASLPIYTMPQQAAQPKSKQSEVYNLIISDLTTAISLLENYARPNKGYIDKNVAKGLLAYTYAAMGENAKAGALSLELINTTTYPVTSQEQAVGGFEDKYNGGFNSISTPSWMWGFDLTNDNGLDLISWWGQMDMFTYSYQSVGDYKTADAGLVSSIPDYDIRKQQFAGEYNGYKYFPTNKFYNAAREVQGARNVTDDYIYMRIDEFHMLAAESLAKSGSEAQAKTILKNYLRNRYVGTGDTPAEIAANLEAKLDSDINGLAGQSLLDFIYKNTRIEFWGEGKSYLAMKRNRATVTRSANHQFFPNTSYSYDDPKLSFKIPQAEIQNNPYLD